MLHTVADMPWLRGLLHVPALISALGRGSGSESGELSGEWVQHAATTTGQSTWNLGWWMVNGHGGLHACVHARVC